MPNFELKDFQIPNTCGECKFCYHYDSGPYARNPHCCCELAWMLKDEDWKVDKDSVDEDCPLRVLWENINV